MLFDIGVANKSILKSLNIEDEKSKASSSLSSFKTRTLNFINDKNINLTNNDRCSLKKEMDKF